MNEVPYWISTRGAGENPVPFLEALRQGLAPDGGLYVPDRLPDLPPLDRASDFASMAVAVLGAWFGPPTPAWSWAAAVREALSFPVPLVPLAGGAWDGIHVLELYHGPTHSFKDFGARTMARLAAAAGSGGPVAHVFVATSGDTGSAVADGFSGVPGYRVVLLFPEGRISPVQEAQLVVRRPGVVSFRVRGSFDDCQAMAKRVFADRRFDAWSPTSANSINAGRLLPQSLYYLHAARSLDEAPAFSVPSGNLGNLTAGLLAAACGMRHAGFVAAHNANDAFPRFLDGAPARFGASVETLSNAMDVGAPSNFERLDRMFGASRLREVVRGISVDDTATLDAMRSVYTETGVIVDPHTAVGLEAVRRLRQTGALRNAPVVVLSTAHPAKFPETVRSAIGIDPPSADGLETLRGRPTRCSTIDAGPDALLAALEGADFSA